MIHQAFPKLLEQEAEDVRHEIREKTFSKGTVLYRIGDALTRLCWVIEGEVRVYTYDQSGHRVVVTSFGPGELFGESVALAQLTSPYEIIVETQSILGSLEAAVIQTLGSRELLCDLLIRLARKNAFLTHRIQVLSRITVAERILESLNFYAQQQQSLQVHVPYNRSEFAEYLGVNRSALSSEIRKLQEKAYFVSEKQMFRLNEKYFRVL